MPLGIDDKIEDVRVFLEKAAGIAVRPTQRRRATKTHANHKKGSVGRVHRFRNVFAKPLEMLADFVPPVYIKTRHQREALDNALADNFVFLNQDPKTREALVNALEPIRLSKGHVVIKQGDLGDYFYVIEKGTVVFIVDGKRVGTGEAGRCFGELALLYDCPRAATVICETDCQLWRVDQHTVRKIKAARAIKNRNEAKTLTRKIPFLAGLSEEDKDRFADALQRKFFAPGDILLKKGLPCETFFIIQKGEVRGQNMSIGETRFASLTAGPGGYFGQSLIESGTPSFGHVTAHTNVTAFTMSRENFIKILGDRNLDALILESRERLQLMAIPIFASTDLDFMEVRLMHELMQEKQFKKGHVFAVQGEAVSDPAVYMIRSGEVSVSNPCGGADKVLHAREHFGDDQLVPQKLRKGIVAKHTIVCTKDARIGVLTLDAIGTVIVDITRIGKKLPKNAKMDKSITLESLEKHKILGAGTFGQVWLVCEKDKRKKNSFKNLEPKTPYALKIQYKRDLIGYNQVAGVINEKNIMEVIDHPFVISLVNSFKDKLRVYMLMHLVQGGELFSIIHTKHHDGIPEDEAVFYAAGVLEGLSYMHRRNIIHRDLKAENVLMDNDGYCVLVDLGFAKIISDKTYTCCGTPIFMAPEVILGEGHNQGADYWSLGVLVYDMIVGHTPFYEPGMNQLELYQRIVRGKFSFPKDSEISPTANTIIRELIDTDPSFRLGCLARGDLDIRDHPWFKKIDFGKLFRKELEAPWIPDIKDPFDVSQFDDWTELEKESKERAPLSDREEKLFDRF